MNAVSSRLNPIHFIKSANSHVVRRSRMVWVGKRALLVFAVLLFVLIAVMFWIQSNNGTRLVLTASSGSAPTKNGSVMIKPRYQGTDSRNRPFTVDADEAIQHADKTVDLINLSAEMTTEKGNWLSVLAKKGLFVADNKTLTLDGDVHMFYDGGYEFSTEKLVVLIDKGEASSEVPVQGQGPAGTLKADHFKAENRGARLLFNDNVKVTLYP